MSINSRWFLGLGILISLAASALGQGVIVCSASSTAPFVRAEGNTELVGDIVITCTGGTPTPAGALIAPVDIQIFLNTNITSKLTDSSFSEAILLVDEPNSASNPSGRLLTCGDNGAPDNGPNGPGVCEIVSTGNPAQSYDGTAYGYGGGSVCDGLAGRPVANTYDCGRPNAFQGMAGTPQNSGQSSTIFFSQVPLDAPGQSATRTLRITNLRANAAGLGVSLFSSAQVSSIIIITGRDLVVLTNPELVVGNVAPGLTAAVTSAAGATSPIRILEGFAASWKPKNISFTVGDNSGTPGNATFQNNAWTYNGGTNYPLDDAQNVVGVVYGTESGFEWQGNSTFPSPNPPAGFGVSQVSDSGGPLQSFDTSIRSAGVASAGTRIQVSFNNIPSGASVQVPAVLYLFPQGFTHNGNPAQFQAGASGVMELVNTAELFFTPGNGTLSPQNNVAVYEVLYADARNLEYTDVPFTLTNAPIGTALQVSIGFAPSRSDAAASQASEVLPVPRFINRPAAAPCSSGICLTAFPSTGNNGATSNAAVTCINNGSVDAPVRAEGLTEPLGDLYMYCAGGVPTPAGQPVPTVNLTVTLGSANFTSKVLAGEGFSEALLILDDPNTPGANMAQPILNCGATGAPDSGPSGAGVCSTVSTGDPSKTYDGTQNGYGSSGAVCDGQAGRPAPNSYGCGRPNVFQARIGTPGNPNQLNSITFYGVPFDPPGNEVGRTVRVTNMRTNAASIGASNSFFAPMILPTVTINGPVSIAFPPSSFGPFIGTIQPGLLIGANVAGPNSIRISEGFAAAWRPKNISFYTGDHSGTPGNATFQSPLVSYNGGTNYPADVAQNVAGVNYGTESAFQWQNNASNGPPSINPPAGYGAGSLTVDSNGEPFNSAGFGGLNTGISQTGVADAGTRIAIRFPNIPQGASVTVPQTLPLFRQNCAPCCTQTGVLVRTSTDAAGTGLFTPTSSLLTSANDLAVYEVLWADVSSLEYADIPFTLTNAAPGTTLQTVTNFAPFYSVSSAAQPSNSLPVPRFIDPSSYVPCVSGPCITLTPAQGTNNGSVSVIVSGAPVLSGAQVKLSGVGPDIPGVLAGNPGISAFTVVFDLTGQTPGARDVVITPLNMMPITLSDAFSVLAAPVSCSFTVGPQGPSFSFAGGNGDLVVTPNLPQCNWSSSTATPWIALLPRTLSTVQPYTVAANPTGNPRTGSILIAGQNVSVSQTGACTFAISPGGQTFSPNGGTLSVNVSAPSGCAWTAASTLSWLHVSAGASGSGPGWVTLQADANAAGLRSGTAIIAGQAFAASQGAGPCGNAVDVSSQISVVRGAYVSNFIGTSYVQQIRLTNQGTGVGGPVYLVVDGVPLIGAPCVGAVCGITPAPPLTFCQSPTGSSLVLAAANGMVSGQVVNLSLSFTPGHSANGVPPTWSTTRVFSGNPSQ